MNEWTPGGAVRLLLCTVPDEAAAERIARVLVEERLAACVNMVPGLRSIYAWKGRIEDDREVLLLIKSTDDHLPALAERVRSLHRYENPEVIALPVEAGLSDYLDWVRASVKAT
ncbi:MAG: divalent-cation tolerance protein CutA [Deltaproteobacteria bacterium]